MTEARLAELCRLVGRRLEAARESRGLSKKELCELAHLDQGAYSLISRGLSSPSLQTIFLLADALGITAASVMPDATRPELIRRVEVHLSAEDRLLLRVLAATPLIDPRL